MAWLVLTWKILRIFQSQFILGEVRALKCHSLYTNTLCIMEGKKTFCIMVYVVSLTMAKLADILHHEVYTVREKGWNGKPKGELLNLMLSDQFEVLV